MSEEVVVTETLSQTVERQAAEIERLRELLREAMECGCIISASNPNGLPSGAEWPFDLYERVSEALGE